HTRSYGDWSSDVCSSDLLGDAAHRLNTALSKRSRHISPKMGEIIRYGGSYAGAYLVKRGRFLASELPAILGRDIAAEGVARLDRSEERRVGKEWIARRVT